jgi:7,8-dihydropterin-6-yl-methyl-4-(beta-D-ribofuranosyl)aminobenzene 5'-phosphate synthase
MRIVTLLENESNRSELKAAHGLSLYLETTNHKILFDLGPNQYYWKNARQMGIDLREVDTVILSHGHDDHAGSLSKFLKHNTKATVYVSRHFFDEHVKVKKKEHINIGIKLPRHGQDRLVFVDEDLVIDEELRLVVDVPYQPAVIPDSALKVYDGGRYIEEDFAHEMYLVVQEGAHRCLFSGCSHKGIAHIVDTIETRYDLSFTHVIGGYHFSHYDPFHIQQTDYLTHIGQQFAKRNDSVFYSCHCTGDDAFYQLKIHMRDKLRRLKTGDTIIL